jgi:DNA repair protein RecO (recombination protein O)
MLDRSRVYKTEVVVLRQRPLGEADRILTLFSADLGKFDAVAKGIRKPGSRKAGHLEPLTHSRLMLARGKNLDIITQSEAIDTYRPLRDDLRRLSCGMYAAELVDRFTADQAESYPVFRLLVETLGRLAERQDVDTVLRYFEINLLAQSGYQPQLWQCVMCQGALQPVENWFSPAAGGAVCPTCTPAGSGLPRVTVNALKVMRLMLSGSFEQAARLRLSHDLSVEIEGHLRSYVRAYIERDLNSLRFLNGVRREPARAQRSGVLS